MNKTVCIFCASSNAVDPMYLEAAREVGRLCATFGLTLLYGGGKVGLMGAAAVAAHAHGGKVIGVIPETLMNREVAYMEADEMVVTRTLFERKEIMIERSGAFLVLPGGFGTLDELLEVITLKQLGVHDKPIYFLTANGYFDPLIDYFTQMERERFAPATQGGYYRVFREPEPMIQALVQSWRMAGLFP